MIPAAALGAAGAAAWVSIGRIPRWLSWGELFLTGFQLCIGAAAVAAIAALAAKRLLSPRRGLRWEQAVQRAAICALWLPPLLILARRDSPWSLAPAVLLAAAAERLFGRPVFGWYAPWSWMAHSVALALLLQAALLLTLAERMGWACAAAGAGVWLYLERAGRPSRKPRAERLSLTPSRRVLAMVTAAALLTVGGLTHYLRGGAGGGEDGLLAKLLGRGGGAASSGKRGPGRDPRKFTSDDLSLSHRAIILWPEQTPGVIGLTPPLPQLGARLQGRGAERPLAIPFSGVYWLLRDPDRAPPPGALTMRGNPAYRSFRSNDSAALKMEARQNLGVMVSTRCCDAIEVSILNADTYHHTVHMELLIRNTALPGKPVVSLGMQPVLSEPRFRFSGPGRAAPGIVLEETIAYPLPAALPIGQFDELWVRFETARLRADKSPRISIESFRLAPRRS